MAGHRLSSALDGGVTLTMSIDRTGLLAPLVDKLSDGLTRRYVNMESAGMKRVCEAKAAASSAPASVV